MMTCLSTTMMSDVCFLMMTMVYDVCLENDDVKCSCFHDEVLRMVFDDRVRCMFVYHERFVYNDDDNARCMLF